MPKRIVGLTDVQVRTAKANGKGDESINNDKKLADGGGLYLLVKSTGGKLWRMDYRFNGKRKTMSFGSYPTISLADARQRREDVKKLLANGIDPGAVKKARKEAVCNGNDNSFEVVARAWHNIKKSGWAESHAKTTLERLTKNIFPWLGSKPVNDISLSDIKSVLHRIEARAPESARRMYVCLNMLFRHCVAFGYIDRNPMEGLKPRDILTAEPVQRHLPAITDPKQLALLLRATDEFKGSFVTKCALQLAAMWFCRPGELRKAMWSEIDWEQAELNIPVDRMKLSSKEKARRKGEYHCIPLSKQALEILRQLQPLSGHSEYIFPGYRTPKKPMSEAAVTAALHRMGYKDEMTWHGFRACARTILDEVLGFRPDFIEHQLAHAVRDALGRAYNRTTHLAERKKMMQQWADYLDFIRHEK